MSVKKITRLFFIVFFVVFSFAQISLALAEAPKSVFDGFYVGTGLGASWLDSSDNDNVGNNSAGLFDLFFGYGHVVRERFYLGGEVGANIYFDNGNDNLTGSRTAPNGDTITNHRDFSTEYGFFARVKPGVLVTKNLLAYASFGAGATRLSFDADNQRNGNSFLSVSDRNWIYNLSVGGGLEYAIWKGLSIGAEYNYLYYPDQEYFDRNGDSRDSNFSNNQVMANLVYRFGG